MRCADCVQRMLPVRNARIRPADSAWPATGRAYECDQHGMSSGNRLELAPHVRRLKSQADRAERAEHFRALLAELEIRELRAGLLRRWDAVMAPLERSFESINAVESSAACIDERALLARL